MVKSKVEKGEEGQALNELNGYIYLMWGSVKQYFEANFDENVVDVKLLWIYFLQPINFLKNLL